MMSLRDRNRQNAMRLTQRTAVDLFIEHGFDEVTVGQIADQVGMAASTLYRHFATKEAIVLWDEHDRAIDDALERELKQRPPWAAMQVAFVEELGSRYDADLEFQLKRISYIYATEQMHAAAVEADFEDRDELANGLRHFLSKKQRHTAPLLAGAAMLALDAAFDNWQQQKAKRPIGELIDEAFRAMSNLEAIH